MSTRFWIVAAVVHLVLISGTAVLGRWMAGRVDDPAPRVLARLTGGAILFLGLAFLVSGLGALAVSTSRFTVIRFLAQALFGEGILLTVALAVVHARRGSPARAGIPAAVAVSLLAVYVEAYHVGPHQLVLRRHEVDLRARGTVRRTLRIVHLSDIQTHAVGAHEAQALALARAQNPDLLLLTGDYVQDREDGGGARALSDLRRLLREADFRPRLGAFAVAGDVERGEWTEIFSGTGIRCLQNETVLLSLPGGVTASLVGLSRNASRPRQGQVARDLVERAPAADLRFVMGHAPDFVRVLTGTNVDLALAGHTHGGQVSLPFFGPPLTLTRLHRRYAGDVNDYEGIALHVSRGICMERGTAPQLRFRVPPEVCTLDVHYDGRY